MTQQDQSSPSYETMLINEALAFYTFDQTPTILVGHSGMNNTTRIIKDGNKQYNLRIYNNHQDIIKLQFEHDMLILLQQRELPIATPVPVPNMSGSTITVLSNGKLVSMFRYIEGERPSFHHLSHVEGLGRATALLSIGLQQIEYLALPAYSPYYEIATNYPALTDERIERLCLGHSDLMECRSLMQLIKNERERLESMVPMFASLPMQWIHGDINSSNAIAYGDEIIGILDFEFVTKDARVMELAVLLSELIKPHTEQLDLKITKMKQAYEAHITLQYEEELLLGDLIKLRAVDVAMHFIGRFEEGLDQEAVLLSILTNSAFTLQYLS